VQDIKENRGYEAADVNGNGFIEQNEAGFLNIGFDHNTDYEYLEHKIIKAHASIGARTYQKYSDTMDYKNGGQILTNQSLKFENTIENELQHTLNLDKDKNGVISLKEGLVEFSNGATVEDALISAVQVNHEAWIVHDEPV